MAIKVAIIYHSGYGHTKLQAEAVHRGAASVDGVEAVIATAEDATADLDQFDDADAIIFGSPTYMGSASAQMTAFMDATSKPWFTRKWKDKLAGGFTNSGSYSGDKLFTLQQFTILAAQQGMIWVGQGEGNELQNPHFEGTPEEAVNRIGSYLGPVAMSRNDAPGPDNPPAGDIKTAHLYGVRMAEAAKRWRAGAA